MKRDIGLLHRAVKFVPNVIVKGTVDLDDVLDELWKVTQEEMDFQAEASNMEEFARLNEDVRFVAVPRLYREYTTERVLVMEYIRGCDITDKKSLEALGYDLNEIGEKLIDNWIRQVMVDGFFHADPHPGNILIRDGKIVWIDMGLMGRLTEHDRSAIQIAIEGIAEDDNGKIEDAVLSIGKFSGKTDKQKLHTGISSLMRSYGRKGLGDINIVSFLGDMMDVMKQNGVQMPHGLTLLARGLNNIEGVLSQVSPDVNMVKIAQARLRQEVFDHINWKEELRNSSVNLYKSAKNLADFPTLLGKLLREYSSGQTRINLDLHTSDELTELLGRLSRHFNLGIWVMALLVSSSILCTTDMKPKLFGIPALGFVGYVLAILLVIYIAVSYLIHRKKK
jgi:ubiquinone biosynthesis protein